MERDGSSSRLSCFQRAEGRRSRAQARVNTLARMCTDLNPLDVHQLLLGICYAAGSEYERERTEEAVRAATDRLIGEGYHVEAASVLVSNCMKPEAMQAIVIGLEAHLSGLTDEDYHAVMGGFRPELEDTPDNKVVARLLDLQDEARRL